MGDEPASPASGRAWVWLLGFTLLGAAIRTVYCIWIHPVSSYISSDMAGAYNAGRAFANPHHVFTRGDFIKPRAMGFTGGFILRHFKSDGLGKWSWLQTILSILTVPLTYVGAFRFFGRRPALLATALMALNPLAISYASFLMVETYSMFFLALTFALLDPNRPLRCLLAGLSLGAAILYKPQGVPVCAMWCLLLFFWPAPSRSLAAWLLVPRRVSAILLGLGMTIAILPECIAVSKVIGKPTFLTPYSGQNFYIGHCNVLLMSMDGGRAGMFNAGVPKMYERNEPYPDVLFHVPVFDSEFYVKEGLKCFRRSLPATLLWLVQQPADAFAGWPGSTIDPFPVPGGWKNFPRYTSVLLEYLFVPLGLVSLWRRRRDLNTWIAFGAPLAAIVGLALLFSGDPRYREPFDLFLVAGSAPMLVSIFDRFLSPGDKMSMRLRRLGTALLPGLFSATP